MIYLVLGENAQAKDEKINELKLKNLVQEQALVFDFESLDANQLSAANLKKSLLSLPVVSKTRLILIRHANVLKKEAIEILNEFFAHPQDDCELILEEIGFLKADFNKITSQAKVFNFGIKEEGNIFDLTKLMAARKSTEALKLLHGFYEQGMYPLAMMGALIWYWGKNGRALGPLKYEKGLKALEAADLNIKRSRLLPEYAIEKLVVELIELQR